MKNSKEIKSKGKITMKGPKVKDRKKFAPPTKVQKSKKDYDRKKKTVDEDEERPTVPLRRYDSDGERATVPLKSDHSDKKADKFQPRKSAKELGKNPTRRTAKQISSEDEEEKSCWKGYKKEGTKKKGGKTVNNCVKESTNISEFIEAVLLKNYAKANKHLKQAVEAKIAEKIQSELNTPLF